MVEPVHRIEALESELARARERIRTLEALSGPEASHRIDVTEHRRADLARVDEQLYRAVIDTSPDAIAVLDVDGRLRVANPQAARLAGFDSVEALLRSVASAIDLAAPGHRERAKRRFADLLQNGHVEHVEYDLLRADGTLVPVELSGSTLRDDEGRVSGAVIVGRDLTQRRRAELERWQLQQQLEQAQRLESLGVLAGGIAHDFNNLLVGILGNASLLRREIPERWNARGLVDRIERAATRASELTRQMLAYAGHGTGVLGPVDLALAARQMAVLLDSTLPENVEVRYQLSKSLPAVRGDSGQIQQVLMNLAANAAEAIGNAPGIIHVATYVAALGPGAIDASTEAPVEPGRYVCLEVTDTGGGMDGATRRRIFEPFFSTKFAGRGLGLAAVAGIVRSHGGAILVSSQPGLGTTFQVYFRPATPDAGVDPGPPTTETPPGARGLVVVADDEDLVRAFCRSALESAGYRVEAAADGLEAVALVESHANEVAAVLLDLHMPNLDGLEALRRIRQTRPGLPALVLSGYGEADAGGRLEPGIPFLQKPFTVELLLATLRAAIDAAPEPAAEGAVARGGEVVV